MNPPQAAKELDDLDLDDLDDDLNNLGTIDTKKGDKG
jgi:hypothetical protein